MPLSPQILRPAAPGPACFADVIAQAALERAWRKVRSNGGGPGGDGITLQDFAVDLAVRLERLRRGMAAGSYRPGPLRRARFRKACGGFRELAIPCVVDRVAQTAVLTALAPSLDARMAEASFAYRPARSVGQALAIARSLIAGGRDWVVDADIEKFFDAIPRVVLVQELAIWVEDVRLLALIADWIAVWAPEGRGVPQGAPLSPLLANLYLHPLDRLLAAAGVAAVRYADDFILLCGSWREAERGRAFVAGLLAARGLGLNERKTRIAPASADIIFLGEPLLAAASTPGLDGPAQSPAAIATATRVT